jgi:transcription termination/antitermination protein NusG
VPMSPPDILVPAWYVVHTKSRFEKVVYEGLCKKSLVTFLPKIRVQSKRRDRKLMIDAPLFPGYLFVRTDLNPVEHLEIVKTVGAVRLIGNKSGPVPVSDEAIDSLKIMVSTENPITTGSGFQKGDRVIVISGPLTGVTGTFSRYRGLDRVIVEVEALGQFAAVEVDLEDVEKLPPIAS